MKVFYSLLAHLFYFLGDLCSKVPTELFFSLYQKFMNLSLEYDSKNDYKIWKLPQKKVAKNVKDCNN